MIKVSFKLTPQQLKATQPLVDALAAQQSAVMGQCWVVPGERSGYGTADFFYLTRKQYEVVDKALREAMKMKEDSEQ